MKKKKNELWIMIAAVVVICIIVIALYYKNSKKEDSLEREANFSEITYQAPSGFEEETYYKTKEYNLSEDSLNCSLDIFYSEKYDEKDLEKWFRSQVRFDLNDELSEFEEVEINGNKMFHIDKTNHEYGWSETYNYYGFESTNYYYKIEYRIVDYKNGDRENKETSPCYRALDSFLSSITVK